MSVALAVLIFGGLLACMRFGWPIGRRRLQTAGEHGHAGLGALDGAVFGLMGLLIAFNVVNMSNQFVSAVWTALNALLQPLLNPIRRIMPNTGSIDFSPLVLIIGLQILQIIVWNLARTM